MVVNQYHVVLVNLDPTVGHEIKKTRPCLVISPNEMNHHLQTTMVAPMTTSQRSYPSRFEQTYGKRKSFVALDQIRTIDRSRIIQDFGPINPPNITKCKAILKEMLVD